MNDWKKIQRKQFNGIILAAERVLFMELYSQTLMAFKANKLLELTKFIQLIVSYFHYSNFSRHVYVNVFTSQLLLWKTYA